ncbi:MAG: GIY-YIG nuclease family protein, partial [Lewinella sp.]|uniref:GIY-YIG nuclease family protein n=1 Tax=Lewinella sp. TaxID=2004506 RepID=UPI003D6A4B96
LNPSLMYYFYILYSLKDGRLYKGVSSDLPARILQHDAGRNKSTKYRRPLILLYFEIFPEKQQHYSENAGPSSLEDGSQLRQILEDRYLLNTNGKIFDQSTK